MFVAAKVFKAFLMHLISSTAKWMIITIVIAKAVSNNKSYVLGTTESTWSVNINLVITLYSIGTIIPIMVTIRWQTEGTEKPRTLGHPTAKWQSWNWNPSRIIPESTSCITTLHHTVDEGGQVFLHPCIKQDNYSLESQWATSGKTQDSH